MSATLPDQPSDAAAVRCPDCRTPKERVENTCRVCVGPISPSDAALSADAEIAKLKHAISGLIPWVASSGRGAAQEALAEACELIGVDPFNWSAHPDVLALRRPDLERRGSNV